jgi:hypothetical protein
MSLVLEALRKQHADADPAAAVSLDLSAQRRRQRPWMVLAALALLLNAGVLTWAFRDRLFGTTVPDQPIAEAPAPTQTPGEPAAAAAPAAAPQAAVTAQAPAQIQTAQPVQTTPGYAVQGTGQVPAQALSPPTDAVPAYPATTAPLQTAPAAVESPTGSDGAGPRVLERVTLDALPADARARFPGIVISTHVYAEDPDLRAIVVNGARLQEGNRVAGLTIREIGPDGVAVEFENYVVEVPIFTDW